jgi:hypothetical protein
MRSRTVLAILSVGFLASGPVSAAKPKDQDRVAKTACLSGDYAKGVAILAELYVQTNDPNFLFNQGRCLEQNVKYVEAAERFREFLRKAPKLSDAEKAEVDKHIADCQAAMAQTQPHGVAATEPSQAAVPVPPPVAPAVAAAAPAESTVAQSSLATPADIAPAPHPWQHTAKWVASGAAVVALGLGVVEYASYSGNNHDFNKNPACTAASTSNYCKNLSSSADTAQTWAIIGGGVALAAAGAAVWLWLTDPSQPPATEHAGLGFSCVPAVAGVSCQGRF